MNLTENKRSLLVSDLDKIQTAAQFCQYCIEENMPGSFLMNYERIEKAMQKMAPIVEEIKQQDKNG